MRWIQDLNAVQHRRPKSILSSPVRPGCWEDRKESKGAGIASDCHCHLAASL